jgi:hypothetical protein
MAIKFKDAKRDMPSKPSQLDKLDDLVKVKERELAEAIAKAVDREYTEVELERAYRLDRSRYPRPWKLWKNEQGEVLTQPIKSFNRVYTRSGLPAEQAKLEHQEQLAQYLKDCARLEEPWGHWWYRYEEGKHWRPCKEELPWNPKAQYLRTEFTNEDLGSLNPDGSPIIGTLLTIRHNGKLIKATEVRDLDRLLKFLENEQAIHRDNEK